MQPVENVSQDFLDSPPFLCFGMKVQDLAKLNLRLKQLSAHHRSHATHTIFDKYDYLKLESPHKKQVW